MLPPVPRRSGCVRICSIPQPCQSSPIRFSGRPAHRPFRGLLSVHSRCGLHTRAATNSWHSLPKGFNHFVASIIAPGASGWSVGRVGFAPTGKRRLCTAHSETGRSPSRFDCQLSALWHLESDNRKLRGLSEFLYLYKKVKNARKPQLQAMSRSFFIKDVSSRL